MTRLFWGEAPENSGGPEWLTIGMAEGECAPSESDLADIPEASSLDDLTARSKWVAVIHPTLISHFFEASPALSAEMAGASAAIVLVPWRPAPEVEAKGEGRISSFLCSAAVLRNAMQWAGTSGIRLRQLCFYLLDALINGRVFVDRLVVRQLPRPAELPLGSDTVRPEAAVIMPHRGMVRHLDTALHFLHSATGPRPRIRVGLDVDEPEEYRDMSARYSNVEFFLAKPAPLGPYVIRQELADRSSEPLIVLHDSDDVSTTDRFEVLSNEMRRTTCDFIGSHEIRVDEIEREVAAIRFPLDVSAALRRAPGHSLLHATAMIGRAKFVAVGGLSTDQRVANDTQFLFRAHFNLRIRNVDAFLYFRRRHGHALTVHPSTGNRIPLRFNLDAAWRADFGAIQRGEKRIEESSLRPLRRTDAFQITRLPR